MFEISVEESFAAAHALRAYRGKCENVHGHNYRVEVTLEGGQLDGAGLLLDFVELKQWLRAVIERLDHRLLNEVAPFDQLNPTAENMALYFCQEVSRALAASPHAGRVRVARVTIRETDSASAVYRP